MINVYTSAFLRDEIARIIAPSIDWRHEARRNYGYDVKASDGDPVGAKDIDDFILNCWTLEPPLVKALVDIDGSYNFEEENIPDIENIEDNCFLAEFGQRSDRITRATLTLQFR